MPRSLFLRPAYSRFLAIRSELLAICGDRHCEAAILNELEFCTTPDTWKDMADPPCPETAMAQISLQGLEDRILGLYKRRRIIEAIKWLESADFISCQGECGVASSYCVRILNVNNAIEDQCGKERVPVRKGTGTSAERNGPIIACKKDSKDLKDSPLPPTGEDAEIVSFLQDQALQHGVKLPLTGKQKDWLRENASNELRLAALAVMDAHRGLRIKLTETIMAAVGYSTYAGPALGPRGTRSFNRQKSRDAKVTTEYVNPGVAEFEAKLRARGVKTD